MGIARDMDRISPHLRVLHRYNDKLKHRRIQRLFGYFSSFVSCQIMFAVSVSREICWGSTLWRPKKSHAFMCIACQMRILKIFREAPRLGAYLHFELPRAPVTISTTGKKWFQSGRKRANFEAHSSSLPTANNLFQSLFPYFYILPSATTQLQ